MDTSNKNKADNAQGENLQLQQQWRQQSSPKQRPYRRRIRPPPAKVHHVNRARFRRFVQRRTCCLQALPQPNAPPCGSNNSGDAAPASTSSHPTTATTNLLQLQPPPADTAVGGRYSAATDGVGCLDAAAGKSMQEAYMAWCSSNDIPISPGTMAELVIVHRGAPLQ
jgi:hypothetical protein